eukprot:88744_1
MTTKTQQEQVSQLPRNNQHLHVQPPAINLPSLVNPQPVLETNQHFHAQPPAINSPSFHASNYRSSQNQQRIGQDYQSQRPPHPQPIAINSPSLNQMEVELQLLQARADLYSGQFEEVDLLLARKNMFTDQIIGLSSNNFNKVKPTNQDNECKSRQIHFNWNDANPQHDQRGPSSHPASPHDQDKYNLIGMSQIKTNTTQLEYAKKVFQDAQKLLQSAKMEYKSAEKQLKSTEKYLESIDKYKSKCNWNLEQAEKQLKSAEKQLECTRSTNVIEITK